MGGTILLRRTMKTRTRTPRLNSDRAPHVRRQHYGQTERYYLALNRRFPILHHHQHPQLDPQQVVEVMPVAPRRMIRLLPLARFHQLVEFLHLPTFYPKLRHPHWDLLLTFTDGLPQRHQYQITSPFTDYPDHHLFDPLLKATAGVNI